MTNLDREVFQVRSYEIVRGSLIADLGVVLTAAQLAFPIINTFGPVQLWEHTKEAFDLLRMVFEGAHGRRPVEYVFQNNGDVTIYQGNVENHYNVDTYRTARASVSYYRTLSQLAEPAKVTNIQLSRGRQTAFKLDPRDADVFDVPVHSEEEEIEIQCEVYRFNKESKLGKLHVKPGQDVPEGSYGFDVVERQNSAAVIELMQLENVPLRVVREIRQDPFAGDSIVRLRVVGVPERT